MKKVLIIDDSDVNLYLIQTIFEDDPEINVILESDSTKAMDVISKSMPDVLVLDLMMPFVDGFELLRLIKQNGPLTRIPVLVISANLDETVIASLNNYGIKEYMAKPIDLLETEKRIRSLIWK